MTSIEKQAQHETQLGEAVLMPLDGFDSKPIAWLWPGRVPMGKVTLLAGDPGLGKSFVTLDLAARTTKGLRMPGQSREDWFERGAFHTPGDVLLLSAEDDPSDTIRPRLEAMGADVGRVHLLGGVHSQNDVGRRVLRLTELDRDMPQIHRALDRLGDEGRKPKLVVIDPVSAYMGQTDSHNNAQVRQVLAELARLAAHHGVAVVCVTHLNKGGGQGASKAVYRSMGSLAFTAAARVVLMVAKHPDDETKRVVLAVKSNLGAEAQGLAYRIVPGYRDENDQPGRGKVSEAQADRELVPLIYDDSGDQGLAPTDPVATRPSAMRFVPARELATTIEWLDERVRLTADELENPEENERTDAVSEAEVWLTGLLANGPVSAKEVTKRCVADGLSITTVRRAKRRLGIDATRMASAGDEQATWVWSLPEGEPADQTESQGELGELMPTEIELDEGKFERGAEGYSR